MVARGLRCGIASFNQRIETVEVLRPEFTVDGFLSSHSVTNMAWNSSLTSPSRPGAVSRWTWKSPGQAHGPSTPCSSREYVLS